MKRLRVLRVNSVEGPRWTTCRLTRDERRLALERVAEAMKADENGEDEA